MHRGTFSLSMFSPPDRFLEVILKLRGQNSREDTIFVPRRWKEREGGKKGREGEREEKRGSEGGGKRCQSNRGTNMTRLTKMLSIDVV